MYFTGWIQHIDIDLYPSRCAELEHELEIRNIKFEKRHKFSQPLYIKNQIPKETDEIKEVIKPENRLAFDKKLKTFFLVISLIIIIGIAIGDRIKLFRESLANKYISKIEGFGLDPLYVTNILMIVLIISYKDEYQNWKTIPAWVKLLAGSALGYTILISLFNFLRLLGYINY